MNINGFALVLSRVKFFNRWIVLFIDLFLSILATATSLSFLWYILGTELVAAKVYVTVGDTNNYEVGIKKSSLTGDDRIIASSDKKIEAGDTGREK